VSLGRVVKGLTLGVLAGTVLALVAGSSRLGEDLIDPPVQMIRTIPVLALTPLFILWFGIGETPKVLMIALGTTFPIYLNTYAGIRGIDARLVDAAKTLGLGRLSVVRRVILPGALPGFLTGLRYSAGIAWLVLVVGEQINASSGIGYLITEARAAFRTDVIVLGLAIYGVLGLLTDLIVRTIEGRALSWRPNFLG
jgi:sulfonate transport system permease protein